MAASASDLVKLNVGGWKFTTTVSTLTGREPGSMLSRMFSDEWRQNVGSASSEYFIDRDGRIFGYILNFLRDGPIAYIPDDDTGILQQLRREAEFFQLNEMSEKLAAAATRPSPPQITVGAVVHWRPETIENYWPTMARVLFDDILCGTLKKKNHRANLLLEAHIYFGVLLPSTETAVGEIHTDVDDICVGCGQVYVMRVMGICRAYDGVAGAVKQDMARRRCRVVTVINESCVVIEHETPLCSSTYLHVSRSLLTTADDA